MDFYVGQEAVFSKTISEYDVYSFAGISGDFNSIHINEIEAKRSIFGKRIAHGMIGGALISTVLGMYLPGPGTIYLSQNLQFKKPVYIGDTLTAKVVIEEIAEKGRARLYTEVKNQNEEKVILGEANVLLP